MSVRHIESGFRLGAWVNRQRTESKNITTDKKWRLDAIGFVWDMSDALWEDGFSSLKKYWEREGHCRVPQRKVEDGFRVGQWVAVQRASDVSQSRKTCLDSIGFLWDVLAEKWEEGFMSLLKFYKNEGHCRVPALYHDGNYKLGGWVRQQRHTKNEMSEERQQRLNRIDFVWDIGDAEWRNAFSNLLNFREREGHCRVPYSYSENGLALGAWVTAQRKLRIKMGSDRQDQLSAIGFVWSERDASWDDGFSALIVFQKREGHCRVQQSHREGETKLGQWVSVQRIARKRMTLSRLNKLDELGFVWDARND